MINGWGVRIKHNSEQRQRPTARLSVNQDKLYPEGGCREGHTQKSVEWTGSEDFIYPCVMTAIV